MSDSHQFATVCEGNKRQKRVDAYQLHWKEIGQEQTFDGRRKFVNNRRTCARRIVQAALLEISKLTVEERRSHLLQLIETCVTDSGLRDELPFLVVRRDIPAKGVLVQLPAFMPGRVSESDANIIDEIALYFC
ncbi:MAG TPA: hypothetical protein VF534_33720 [Paraburkholderia sp.]